MLRVGPLPAPDSTPLPRQINVVVMRGANCDELGAFAALAAELPLNVRFIEYMPFDGNVWSDAKMVPFREMRAAVEACFPQGLERLQARFPRPFQRHFLQSLSPPAQSSLVPSRCIA